MKLLIIGSKGFIGKHCVDFFSKNGNFVYEADIIDDDATNYFKLNPSYTDFNRIFENNKFDICINCSGSANVSFSFENPEIDFELNVVNVQKLLAAILIHNSDCKFINFSSAAVYGNPKSLPIKENFILKPLSPYGFHKLQSEFLLKEYHKFFNLKTCSLRVFSAYGPGLRKQLFWDLFLKCSQENFIKLYGTGNESRDFIYIDDLLQAVDLVIYKSSFKGEVFNVASGKEVSIKEATEIFLKYISTETKLNFSGEQKKGDPNNWLADISSLTKLGFKQKVSFELGIKNVVKWMKEDQ